MAFSQIPAAPKAAMTLTGMGMLVHGTPVVGDIHRNKLIIVAIQTSIATKQKPIAANKIGLLPSVCSGRRKPDSLRDRPEQGSRTMDTCSVSSLPGFLLVEVVEHGGRVPANKRRDVTERPAGVVQVRQAPKFRIAVA